MNLNGKTSMILASVLTKSSFFTALGCGNAARKFVVRSIYCNHHSSSLAFLVKCKTERRLVGASKSFSYCVGRDEHKPQLSRYFSERNSLFMSRLFHSSNGNYHKSDNGSFFGKAYGALVGSDEKPGFFKKVKRKITGKKPKPSSDDLYYNRSEARYREEDVSKGLQTLLKDAPFPVRMIGRLMSPVLKSMANEFARQGEEIDLLLEDARSVIGNDSAAISALGEPFSCSRPFQQSASSISINGKMKKSIDVRFEVMGSHGSGIASMSAVGNQSKETVIENLVIAMSNGRSISIKNLNPRRRRGSYDTVPGSPSSDIIDVEFEEKK